MTPKEKAEKLVDRFINQMPKYLQGKLGRLTAIQSALICVDEIIEELREEIFIGLLDESNLPKRTMYWQKVKQEINQIKEDE
mgnify:FL=1